MACDHNSGQIVAPYQRFGLRPNATNKIEVEVQHARRAKTRRVVQSTRDILNGHQARCEGPGVSSVKR
jgi:hypothetical protein